MRTARSRKHKGFDLDKRLAAVEWALERDDCAHAGSWSRWRAERELASAVRANGGSDGTGAPREGAEATDAEPAVPSAFGPEPTAPSVADAAAQDGASVDDACAPRPFREVRLDLGCGKGTFTVAAAKREPDVLFCGIDTESVCVMHAAELACAEHVPNAAFLVDEDPDLARIFAPGELGCIYLNFPTPFPKKKKAPLRLTHAERLIAYRTLLAPGGMVRLRTDSQPFADWSLIQFDLAGYTVVFQTDDLRATDGESPSSEYELKTSERGGTVHAIDAVPGPRPAPAPGSIVQPVPESLFEYLPDDLEHLEYVPLGMAGAVENMRNHRRRMAAHAAREQARAERDGREQAAVEQAARDARALEERAAQLAQDAQADADTATNPRWR